LFTSASVRAKGCVTDRVSHKGVNALHPWRENTRIRQFSVCEKNPDSQYLRRKLNETYNPNKWAVNAAVLMPTDSEAQFTEDELETTFQTNFLAPFLITNLTTDLINAGGRVIVSSSGLYSGQVLNLDGMVEQTTGCYASRRRLIVEFCTRHHRVSPSRGFGSDPVPS
jgi:hypothetical protein